MKPRPTCICCNHDFAMPHKCRRSLSRCHCVTHPKLNTAACAEEQLRPYEVLYGTGNIDVVFREPVSPTMVQDGQGFLFMINVLGLRVPGRTRDEAAARAADTIAEDVNRLTRAFAYDLTEAEREYRGKLLAHVDILGGELGIDFPADRWLVGHIECDVFIPVQDDFKGLTIPVAPALRVPLVDGTSCRARVATYRDGFPKGEVLEIEPR